MPIQKELGTVPGADYHHRVDTTIGASVHVVSRARDDTGKEGVINDSERLFSRRVGDPLCGDFCGYAVSK